MQARPDVVLNECLTQSGTFPHASVRRAVPIPMGPDKNELETKSEGTFFTFDHLVDGKEHIAIGFGDWKQATTAPLVRIHSECLTGDVFASGKCDCGEQLAEAIELMKAQGGILLYLRQEGRGIGLYNKLDAYEFQRQGFDTYEANRLVGFEDDLRDYTVAAQMLKALDVSAIRLLSNNPDKRDKLRSMGIDVQSEVSTGVFVKDSNRNYLAAKVTKTGHKINL